MTDKRSCADLTKLDTDLLPGVVYYFNRIKVLSEHEGTGEGRELMIEVCRYADKLNATIYNELNPYGKRNMKSLIRFFKASGFKIHKEFSDHTMIRKPNMQPYLKETEITTRTLYNPNYGDDRICICGHIYYRHFDSYEDMYDCGCKYCECCKFKEKEDDK